MSEIINQEDFWNNCYLTGQTGWDMHQASPPLTTFLDSLNDKSISILIPGCGNAHEVDYLMAHGFHRVTVIDIANSLVKKLQDKFKGMPVKIINGDFFNHEGNYDLILEQTFFCAIPPYHRKNYVLKMHELLNDRGLLAGVLFKENYGFADHPPYQGSKNEYVQLFSPYFNILKIELCNNSIAPRMGNEYFVKLEKKRR